MKKCDLCFFYHSVTFKEIVGIVKVVRESYPDPTDIKNKFVMIDVKTQKKLKTPKKFLHKGRMPSFDFDIKTTILLTKYILGIRTKP